MAEKSGEVRAFFPQPDDLTLRLPLLCIAAVVDRAELVARYKAYCTERLWLMCQMAYYTLFERVAKYADSQGRVLQVFLPVAVITDELQEVRHV